MTAGRQFDELDPAFNWSCGYMTAATDPACLADARWHGFHITDNNVIGCMTACCDRHLPIMRLSTEYVHDLDGPCGLPGSMFMWPDNYCYLPDDSLTLAVQAEAVMS